jgi:6-pyruvoyltetrahydropterin/6-carboxytetrahydropterin synthase
MTYRVTVTARFEAAHNLIHFRGQPEPLHGHSYRVEAALEAESLDADELAADFTAAREELSRIAGAFDYTYLNETPPFRGRNTSAENIARHFAESLAASPALGTARLAEVTVWEGPENRASYRPERRKDRGAP